MSDSALSADTVRLLQKLHVPAQWVEVAQLLETRCGNALFSPSTLDPGQLERFRFAVLRLGGGDPVALRRALDLAQVDWRDLLMAADFGVDVNAHRDWYRQVVGDASPP